MDFFTHVAIAPSQWHITHEDRLLFVGSCFATNIGQRFCDDLFRANVNPYGVMYNPISVLHTIVREAHKSYDYTVITLGTNHVYIDRTTEQVVDNCEKRPAKEFIERVLTVDECVTALQQVVDKTSGRIVLTVSPIRYKKYGYHESQLSKATLLLAADYVQRANRQQVQYFPAYELVVDELRDYRFYAPDMLHPSAQTVDYLFSRFADTYFSAATHDLLQQWQPIKLALRHVPQHPESDDYHAFVNRTNAAAAALQQRYPYLAVPTIDL